MIKILIRIRFKSFYNEWIKKSIDGKFDDVCFILRANDMLASYCTISYVSEHLANIGLIAVNQKIAGHGFGKNYYRM